MKRSREILDRLKADGERLPVPESLKPEWIDETIKELEREEKKSRAGRSRRKETGRGRAGRFQIRALNAISAFTVNLSYNLEPVYSILLAMVIFREHRGFSAAFCLCLILLVLSVTLQSIRQFRSAQGRKS